MDKNFHREFNFFLNVKRTVSIDFFYLLNRNLSDNLFLFRLLYNKI
jgi:hypothetical protein